MPNYCNYYMRVVGKKRENVKEFIEVMNADYNYRTGEFSAPRHMFRVFDATPVFDDSEDGIREDNGTFITELMGDCAWSVYCCMCAGDFTYYNQLALEYQDIFRGTTLQEESERLNLSIEVFSSEPGMCFSEHLLYKNGEEIADESCEYAEYSPEWYDSYEEFCEHSGYKGSEEKFNEEYPEGIYIVGGFKEEFAI